MSVEKEMDPNNLGIAEEKDFGKESSGERKFAVVTGGHYFGEVGEETGRDEEGNVKIKSELSGEIIVPSVNVELVNSEKDAIKKSMDLIKEDKTRKERVGL